MGSKVKKEKDLYPGMCRWLERHLTSRYGRQNCKIIVEDSHSVCLGDVLRKHKIEKFYPQIVGVPIEVDILGIVAWKNKAKLFFIEAKKTTLNLQNLGQLLVYCRLCNPEEAYLLSSHGLGSLNKVLNNMGREDILSYGQGKQIKMIKVAKWDVMRETIDQHSLVPKI